MEEVRPASNAKIFPYMPANGSALVSRTVKVDGDYVGTIFKKNWGGGVENASQRGPSPLKSGPSKDYVGCQPEQWVWRPTDLYAAPGIVVSVRIPALVVGKIDV